MAHLPQVIRDEGECIKKCQRGASGGVEGWGELDVGRRQRVDFVEWPSSTRAQKKK